MPQFERTVKIYVEPTPEEIAFCFWHMNADQQAEFFNWLGREVGKHLGAFPMQLQAVMDSQKIDADGRYAMQKIGEYGYPF